MVEPANPEVNQSVKVQVTLKASAFDYQTSSLLSKQLEEETFAEWLSEANKGRKEDDPIKVDFSKFVDFSEDHAKLFVDVMAHYSSKVETPFTSYAQFKEFEKEAEKQGFQSFNKVDVKKAVQRKFPILILIDVGGSILYRSGSKLGQVERRGRDSYCQIKQHHHYYRPQFQHFLAQLIQHPRVKLAFNTSIMRKNVMPLLFQIFDLKELNSYRAWIFEVFDQQYQVPDSGPKGYETKRSLERIFDHPECIKNKFNFTNTFMIDSEAKKIRDYKKNSVAIKPYSLEQVLMPTEDQSLILTEVRDFVFAMLEETTNVQEYLAEHKPSFSSWEELLTEEVGELASQMAKLDCSDK